MTDTMGIEALVGKATAQIENREEYVETLADLRAGIAASQNVREQSLLFNLSRALKKKYGPRWGASAPTLTARPSKSARALEALRKAVLADVQDAKLRARVFSFTDRISEMLK